MRPKLPLNVVRRDLSWQFQIRRCIPIAEENTDTSGHYPSFQETMVGTHAGAISNERLESEADFTPTKGKLVLLEYSEERPPIRLTKGMSSKIVNYCRGDQTRKRGGEGTAVGHDEGQFVNRNNRLTRLEGPNRKTSVIDWVGKIPKESMKDNSENEGLDVLQEGVTEILLPKVHGPFIGEVEDGATITGLINNLFVAPMFRHKPKSSDFLIVLTPLGGAARHDDREKVGVILRALPASIFTVGQTEPRTRVMAPGSQDDNAFIEQFVRYRIARALHQSGGHGLRLDEIQNRVLPSCYDLSEFTLRRLLKQVADFDRPVNTWTSKATGGSEDYPGVDALGRAIAPELVAAFESSRAARQRLLDIGVCQLVDGGAKAVVSVGVVMFHLSAQLNALRKISKMVEKLSKTHSSRCKPVQLKFYEKASEELAMQYKALKQKHAVAQFLYEELQLAPWHTTGEFLDVHKKGKGTGMMQLTGLGDPSGQGEGYSFLREAQSKPKTSVETKKICGSDSDLRALNMDQLAGLLRLFGVPQEKIDSSKRWERVEAIRERSTKAASDGIGGGLERYARGAKMNLSEQRQTYVERIRVIWKRQIAALSASGDEETETKTGSEAPLRKTTDSDKDDSSSDSEDDDFWETLEDEMTGRTEASRLVAEHACGGESEGELSQLRAAAQDQALTKEALELAALRRELKEERLAKEGLKSNGTKDDSSSSSSVRVDRKVIRKRITTTHPDGQQTTKFQFIVHPGEVSGENYGPLAARSREE